MNHKTRPHFDWNTSNQLKLGFFEEKNSKGDAAQNIINQFSFFELVGPPTRTIKKIWVDDRVNHFNHQSQLDKELKFIACFIREQL